MRNIELKARLRDREAAEAACRRLSASDEGDIHQTDTYFHVPAGRLKLRVSEPGDDYLVFYKRPDVPDAKGCDYSIEIVRPGVGNVLSEALGVLAVVVKTRSLHLWKNVRIHLDRVDDLGDFIEFEAVLSDDADDADGHAKLARLREVFDIRDEDLIASSYLELSAQQ
jgi:adenylate cyclase class 2